jgi:glycosyltransferase involved in cell wall biosynthesis
MTAAPVQSRRLSPAPPRARRRVLVSAYAISPVRGSEPGVGWQICSRLAQGHDVTVLCSPGVPGPDANYFRDEVAEYVTEHGPVPGLTMQFVEPPLLSKLFQRESALCRRTLYYTGYAAWQRRAFRVAADLHRDRPFDLVHQLNITGFREPGYLWKLDAPFVWGPIGGAPSFPSAYFDLLGRSDRLYYGLRNVTNRFQKSSARCRAAANKARHIWAISGEDADMAERHWHHPAERMLETGATVRAQGRVRDYDGTRPLRLAWCGQHIGRKALPILLHALARLKFPVELTVIGDGPATPRWRALAESLGLKRIAWAGRVTHAQSLAEVGRADALAFTSVLEGTPHAVLEALSLGVPVICHDACGMGVAVTDDCGVRIAMQNAEASIAGFAEAIRQLAANPMEVVRLSQGALDRAAELDWDSKVERIIETYERVMDLASAACGFAIP